MAFLKNISIVLCCGLVSQNAWAIDFECKFSGERKPTVFKELVSGENIALVGGRNDAVRKKEVYWGDDYVTIIIETTGMATLVVINRKNLSATKRITRAGISRGEASGVCRILTPDKK